MIVGNPSNDFFEENPFIKYKEFFYNISEQEEKASDICWALYLMEFPDSPLYNVPRKDRLQEIKLTYFKGKELPDLERWTRDFLSATMPKEYLLYKIAYDKLEALTYDLQDKDLKDETEWRQSVLLMEKLSKLWDSMENLRDRYEESKAKSTMRGGGSLSARELRNGG
jgi:hypothetical protein